MRNTFLSALSLCLLTACVSSESPDCGDGDAFEWAGEVLCMYHQPVLIEEGFSCPPEAGDLTPTDGGAVCAPEQFGGDPADAWEAWAAQSPDEPDEDDWELREEPPGSPNSEPIGDSEPDSGFEAVATILRQNCMLGGCHGNPPGAAAVFVVPTGQNATAAEVAETLSSAVPTNSGNRLISPGSPERSELYLRITKPSGDVQLMGKGAYGSAATPLDQAEIEAIEAWIGAGAPFVAQ